MFKFLLVATLVGVSTCWFLPDHYDYEDYDYDDYSTDIGRPDKCARIRCGWPKCFNGARPTTKPGHCCPSCPPKPRCPLPMCRMRCRYGFKKNSSGCQTCTCRKPPCAVPMCRMRCRYGFKKNSRGCQTCQCRKPPQPTCPRYMCMLYCKNGFKKNAKGCPICKCKPDANPCLKHKCPMGQRCELQSVKCFRAPCPPIPVCKKPTCPQYMCMLYCKNGFKKNAKGCSICKCKPDANPCLKKKCPSGQTCKLAQLMCIRAPCPPFATCVKKTGLHSDCKLQKKTGHCRAAMPRYYYNSATKSCQRFTYGGCGANANNFGTLEACKAKCS